MKEMEKQIKTKQYFIACFDSLKQMNKIIEHLSQFGNKEEWLIYSSEVDYDLIDTKLWIDKHVFFTPSILYGIDFNHKLVDVFSFVYKNHLNPLQIYQMISRARQQNKVYIYCNERESYIKYKSVEDIIYETELYEKNFGILLPLYNNYIDIDDKPYRTMYYNFRFMDAILKTNIKGYLTDILIEKGYNISYNDIYTKPENNTLNKETLQKKIKEKIVNLLYLDKDNLTDFEKSIESFENFVAPAEVFPTSSKLTILPVMVRLLLSAAVSVIGKLIFIELDPPLLVFAQLATIPELIEKWKDFQLIKAP